MEKQAEQVEEKKVEEEKTDSPASLRVVKEQDAASEETEEKKDKENDMEKNDSDEKKNYLEEMSRLDAEEEQLKLEQEKKASEKRRLAENLVKELEQKNKEILALNSKLKEEIKNNVEKMRQNEAMIKEQVEKEVAAKNEELLKANAGIQERIEKNLAQLKENESLKNNAERSSGAKPLSLRPVHNPLEIDADESVLSSLVKKASNYMAPLSLSTSNIVRGPQSGLGEFGEKKISDEENSQFFSFLQSGQDQERYLLENLLVLDLLRPLPEPLLPLLASQYPSSTKCSISESTTKRMTRFRSLCWKCPLSDLSMSDLQKLLLVNSTFLNVIKDVSSCFFVRKIFHSQTLCC